jgi:hypothetical protein
MIENNISRFLLKINHNLLLCIELSTPLVVEKLAIIIGGRRHCSIAQIFGFDLGVGEDDVGDGGGCGICESDG